MFFILTLAYGQTLPDLTALCVKHARPDLNHKQRVCECTVKKTYTHLSTQKYSQAEKQKRLKWYQSLLALQLSQRDIDLDQYDIFEIDYQNAQNCISPK